jgi:hypothetical protein
MKRSWINFVASTAFVGAAAFVGTASAHHGGGGFGGGGGGGMRGAISHGGPRIQNIGGQVKQPARQVLNNGPLNGGINPIKVANPIKVNNPINVGGINPTHPKLPILNPIKPPLGNGGVVGPIGPVKPPLGGGSGPISPPTGGNHHGKPWWPPVVLGCAPCVGGGGYYGGYYPPVYNPTVVVPAAATTVIAATTPTVVNELVATAEQPAVAPAVATTSTEKLPEVPVGSTVTLNAKELGPTGQALLVIDKVTIGIHVDEWTADHATATLPSLMISSPTPAEIVLVKADGYAASTVKVQLVPAPQATSETLASMASLTR